MINTYLKKTFNIKYPIILAPMFLVSNEEMLINASKAGIMGCVPSLNYRTPELLKEALLKIKNEGSPFGVNLIVNKSNIHLTKHLEVCLEVEPDFIITSLGSPRDVIKRFKDKKTKIFCDVIDEHYAKVVEDLGADAIIAVNSGAGGHCGPIPASVLIPKLKKACSLPIISAGGVGNGQGMLSMLALGAEGLSMGSIFIATKESPAGDDYKKACVDYNGDDIILTTKISGTPCTVINTPYVKKIGNKQNFLESFLNNNKALKKYAKMITYYKGTKLIEKAAFSATYKTVWCAGPSIEFTKEITDIKTIVDRLVTEYNEALNKLCVKESTQLDQLS